MLPHRGLIFYVSKWSYVARKSTGWNIAWGAQASKGREMILECVGGGLPVKTCLYSCLPTSTWRRDSGHKYYIFISVFSNVHEYLGLFALPWGRQIIYRLFHTSFTISQFSPVSMLASLGMGFPTALPLPLSLHLYYHCCFSHGIPPCFASAPQFWSTASSILLYSQRGEAAHPQVLGPVGKNCMYIPCKGNRRWRLCQVSCKFGWLYPKEWES